MKPRNFATLLIVCMASSAVADEATWRSYCEKTGTLAEEIMKKRQAGIPMAKMIEIAGGNKLMEDLVITAFDGPRFNSESYRERATADFRDTVYLECVKANRPE